MESKIVVQGFDDLGGEPPHIRRRDMGAFGDLERVESDQVDGGDLTPLQWGKNVRIRLRRKIRQNRQKIHKNASQEADEETGEFRPRRGASRWSTTFRAFVWGQSDQRRKYFRSPAASTSADVSWHLGAWSLREDDFIGVEPTKLV